MSDVVDIFSKKKPIEQKKESLAPYEARKNLCKAEIAKNGQCKCVTCQNKVLLVMRMVDLSNAMLSDYVQKTGDQLYYGDWVEVLLATTRVVKERVYPKS